MRTRVCRRKVFGEDVVDLVLLGSRAADVVHERLVLFVSSGMGACESKQSCQLLEIFLILYETLFDDLPKLVPELFVVLWIFRRHLAQHIEHPAR